VAAGGGPTSIAVDPTGRFAYVANSNSNDISTFTINAATGALTPLGAPLATSPTPAGIAVDASGRFAYVTSYNSNTVTAYRINSTTGALSQVGAPVN
jgi:6-phosphogluconolactonase (cycloisomerase 2 family)